MTFFDDTPGVIPADESVEAPVETTTDVEEAPAEAPAQAPTEGGDAPAENV